MNHFHRASPGRRRVRGISLIEALVALVVMSFGTLAVLGVQYSLRSNADVARQRSEATRLAQRTMEAWRSDAATVAEFDAAIVSNGPADVSLENSNTIYRVERIVDASGGHAKVLRVEVKWHDRTDAEQQVAITSTLQRVDAQFAGSLVVPADLAATRMPRGRNPVIPPTAIDVGGGRSEFTPPSSPVSWRFDNVSGYIVQSCIADVCTDFNARLLAGHVRFATGTTQPTGAQSELPELPGDPALLGAEVIVDRSLPPETAEARFDCFEQTTPDAIEYFCAVPLGDPLGRNVWSGRSTLSGLTLATSNIDATATRYRVCRYTPIRDAHPTVESGAITNSEHPLNYWEVSESLVDQNFLVIRAGDGTAAFFCPDDVDETRFVDGTTWHHQPSS